MNRMNCSGIKLICQLSHCVLRYVIFTSMIYLDKPGERNLRGLTEVTTLTGRDIKTHSFFGAYQDTRYSFSVPEISTLLPLMKRSVWQLLVKTVLTHSKQLGLEKKFFHLNFWYGHCSKLADRYNRVIILTLLLFNGMKKGELGKGEKFCFVRRKDVLSSSSMLMLPTKSMI